MISLTALTVLVSLAVGASIVAIILLVALAVKDYLKEELW